jgi:hypothetical protein
MEFEEFERSMEFLLAQQAQFAADLQRSGERHDRQMADVMRALMIVGAKLDGLAAANVERIEDDRRLNLSIDNVHKWLGGRIEEGDQWLRERMEAGDQWLRERMEEGDKWLRERMEEGDTWLRGRMEEGDTWLRGRIDEVDRRLAERVDALGRKCDELAESQKETRANLDALIQALEENARGRRNGGRPQ